MSIHPKAAEIFRVVHERGYDLPSGRVDLGNALAGCVGGSRTWTPDELAAIVDARTREASPPGCAIEVTGETTQAASFRLSRAGAEHLALLNFASAKNPGGGFLGGARAQEEDLCRCSLLYPAIAEQTTYYEVNRARRGPDTALYSDHLITSPSVPFLRVRADDPWLDTPFFADVITAPAPNAGALDVATLAVELDATFRRRTRMVIALAAHLGHRELVLGAWGCGAFRNDPELAADAFSDALATLDHDFSRVVFAVFDPRAGTPNTRAFERRFAAAISDAP